MSAVDDVKARVDIVELVGNHVRLQRSGLNYKANCPFHEEKTPSFYVFTDRQTWRCFGACAEGGDVFNFVMKSQHVEFGEALRILAQQAGVTLESGQGRDQGQRNEMTAMHELAVSFFQERLQSAEGEPVRRYIAGRGLTTITSDLFKLGYSPQRGNPLTDFLIKQGHEPKQLVRAGLSREDDTGRPYDLFRGRLMIPIADYNGKVVGFGSRALDANDRIKYMNTPETPLFTKSRILYALDRAKESARTQGLVLVEGYMDAIAAHQHGHVNVAASMGTALTEQQVALVRRVSSNVIMALDGDNAGRNATLRSLEGSWGVFQRRETVRGADESVMQGDGSLDLKVAELPQGKDPDDLLRESPEEWRNFIGNAKPLEEYLWTTLSERADMNTADGRAWVARMMLRFIGQMPDRMKREMALESLSSRVRIQRATLEAVMSEVMADRRNQLASQRNHQVQRQREERGRGAAPRERRGEPPRENVASGPPPDQTGPAGTAAPPATSPDTPPVSDEYEYQGGGGASMPYEPGEADWPEEPVDEPPPDDYDLGPSQRPADRVQRLLRGDREREECLVSILIQHYDLVVNEEPVPPEWLSSTEMRELLVAVTASGPAAVAADENLGESVRSRFQGLRSANLNMDSHSQPVKAWRQIRNLLHRQYLKAQLSESTSILDVDDAGGAVAAHIRRSAQALRTAERERIQVR